jgi:hypothetical protein
MKFIVLLLILYCFNFSNSKFLKQGEFSASEPDTIMCSIKLNPDGSWSYYEGIFDPNNFIASAKYTVGLEKIGWDLLAITTNINYEDELQAEAAGRLEGYLTKDRIWNHYRNLRAKLWNNTNLPENVNSFLTDQEAYIQEIYNKNKTNGVSANAYYLLRQFKGLIEAYNQNNTARNIDYIEFHIMSSFGDLFDIIYYNNTNIPDFFSWSLDKIESHILTSNHCSALFKVKADLSDLFFGHNSWFYYSSMTRIFKEYYFNFKHESIKSRHTIFSSYPATLASTDDFYITSQDLVVIETTNSMFNSELFSKLTPRSLLTWQRAMIANRISTSSKEWTENFAKENSGTYNNQFMSLDMKKVNISTQIISDEAMFIVEQIPGYTDINDVTTYLKYGYWPSYNTPFSNKIKELSNITDMIEKNKDLIHTLDYNSCARANIFRRDQGNVNTIYDFMKMIRYNQFSSDPFSMGNPTLSIAARGDLDSNKNHCLGAYDGKVSSLSMAKGKDKFIYIIQGPSNDDQPVFSFKNSLKCKDDPSFGLDNEFKYGWWRYKNQFTDKLIYPDELEYLE